MKFYMPLIAIAVVLFSSVATAYDQMYLDTIGSLKTKYLLVDLPKGEAKIEIYGTTNENISCQFLEATTDRVVFDAKNTTKCAAIYSSKDPITFTAKVTNNGTQELHLRIWVHDTK